MATPSPVPLIFIGYRRDDGGFARDLYEKLRDWFDADQLFLDHENLDAGSKFRPELEQAIKGCQVFLAVIGPQWLSDKNRLRLQEPEDVTRGEIRAALNHGKILIPVLAGGAAFPNSAALPADLSGMGEANAHHQLEAQYRPSFQKLLDKLENRYGLKPAYRRQDGSRQSFHVAGFISSPHFADPTDKLPALHDLLAKGGRAALTAATVQGMGGVGKTQLALKYSHTFREEYEGVWWFRSEDATLLEQDCLELCRERGIAQLDKEAPSKSVARWLKTQPRWLLVYDNADEPKTVQPYLPQAGGHHVLYTSRNPNWTGVLKPGQLLDLTTWSDEQALDFLHSRLDHRLSDDQGRRLSRELGGLPLALEIAAAYLLETNSAVDDYLEALADQEEAPDLLDGRTPDTGYPHGVFAALSLSFGKMTPAARQLLCLCAFAGPEALPERFFREAADKLPAELCQAAGKSLGWNKVAGELHRYGLAQRISIPDLDRATGEVTDHTEFALSLHRLTQQTTRARLADPASDCRRFQAVLRACCPVDANLPAHWPRYSTLAPHVTQLDRYYASGWLDSTRLCWLLDQVANYFRYGPSLYADAVLWFRRALKIHQDEEGEEDLNTLACMNNLAGTLQTRGDLDGARTLEERALEIRRRIQGEEHPNTLTSMNNLAETLRNQGDLEGAQKLHEKALEIYRRVLGTEHPNTLISMDNLALVLLQKGDLIGARGIQEKVLEFSRLVLGNEQLGTLTCMGNLASTLCTQGDLAGARALERRSDGNPPPAPGRGACGHSHRHEQPVHNTLAYW